MSVGGFEFYRIYIYTYIIIIFKKHLTNFFFSLYFQVSNKRELSRGNLAYQQFSELIRGFYMKYIYYSFFAKLDSLFVSVPIGQNR